MELPFLYQTRTILRMRPKCRFTLATQGRRHQSTPSVAAPTREELDQVSFFRRKAQEVASKVTQQASQTITRQEQAAFDSLRRLAGQRELNARLGIAPEPERLDVNPDNILALYTPQAQPAEDGTETDGETNVSAEGVAQQAQAAETERIIQKICGKQLHSLAASFNRALTSNTTPGDLALWEILESDVFPLLALLKDGQKPLQVRASRITKSHTGATAASAIVAAEKAAASKILPLAMLVNQYALNNTSPPSVPPLQVLSRYYPAAILLALRLLTKNHPLSLQTHRLLPHLRNLGPSSYILGVTTPFYNTHLLLRWNTYSSLAEISNTLSEMERSAVEFDRGTHHFLTDLADERARDIAATAHEDPAATREPGWWLQPEQQRWWPAVEDWRTKVARALEEKGMGAVLREGPADASSSYSGGRETPFEGVQPQVWL